MAKTNNKVLIFSIFGIVILVGAIIFLFVPFPTSGGGGGATTYVCDVQVNVSGTFNDFGVTQYLSNLNIQAFEGNCQPTTLLSQLQLCSSAPMNIFPLEFTMRFTVNGKNTGTLCSKTMTINIPAFQTSYPFSSSVSFKLLKDTYTGTLSSPYPLDGPYGQTTRIVTFEVR